MTDQKLETVNIMRKVKLEKVILNCGATGQDLEKAKKLLELLTEKKAHKIASTKRIPNFGVRPDLEVGTRVTLRGKKALEILKRLLAAIDNFLDEKQISKNALSFGIEEYIEIPGVEYQREIGIRGLNVTAVFTRPGVRVKRRKIKKGKIPRKQHISSGEIAEFMRENFSTEVE